jgi:hypothetical protein
LYLLGFLCSAYAKYYILNNSDTTGAGDIMLNIQSLSSIPIPMPTENEKISEIVENILNKKTDRKNTTELEQEIDNIINNIFNFNISEIAFIKGSQ